MPSYHKKKNSYFFYISFYTVYELVIRDNITMTFLFIIFMITVIILKNNNKLMDLIIQEFIQVRRTYTSEFLNLREGSF